MSIPFGEGDSFTHGAVHEVVVLALLKVHRESFIIIILLLIQSRGLGLGRLVDGWRLELLSRVLLLRHINVLQLMDWQPPNRWLI